MVIAALFDLGEIPLHLVDGFVDRLVADRGGVETVGRDHGHLAIVEVDDLSRVLDDRRDVGCEEVLPIADPDHERAALAGPHDRSRLVGAHHRDPIRAFDVRERPPHGLFQVVARRGVLLDEVCEHFGVGFGLEPVTFCFESALQNGVVLDDAVVDQRDAPATIHVRVRIHVIGFAVRRPARVCDAARTLEVVPFESILEFLELALRLHDLDVPVRQDGDARRVVSAVLEPLQSLDEDPQAGTVAHIADDAAHLMFLLRPPRTRRRGRDPAVPAYASPPALRQSGEPPVPCPMGAHVSTLRRG